MQGRMLVASIQQHMEPELLQLIVMLDQLTATHFEYDLDAQNAWDMRWSMVIKRDYSYLVGEDKVRIYVDTNTCTQMPRLGRVCPVGNVLFRLPFIFYPFLTNAQIQCDWQAAYSSCPTLDIPFRAVEISPTRRSGRFGRKVPEKLIFLSIATPM